MQTAAQAWLVYRLIGSAMLLGLVFFAGQIPTFLLAPIGGATAARHNPHRLVILTQTLAMLLSFSLAIPALLDAPHIGLIFALATAPGIVNAFDIPARQKLVVELVGRKDLVNAIVLNSSAFNGACTLGPALADRSSEQ
jgi:MFS family permease